MTQSLRFYHSTVVPDNKITNCFPIKAHEREAELLFTYNNFIQKISLNIESKDLETKEIGRFYTGSKIIWGVIQDYTFATYDDQHVFTLSTIQQSYEKIDSIEIEPLSDGDYDIFAYTPSMQYFLLAKKETNRCILLTFPKGQKSYLQIKILEGVKILDATRSAAPNQFSLLVKHDDSDEKEILTLTLKSYDITNRKECSESTIAITDVNYKKSKVVIPIGVDQIEIPGNPQNPLVFDSNIILYSNSYRSMIIVQLEDKTILLVDLSESKVVLSIQSQKVFKKLVLLPSHVCFGIVENGDNVIFNLSGQANYGDEEEGEEAEEEEEKPKKKSKKNNKSSKSKKKKQPEPEEEEEEKGEKPLKLDENVTQLDLESPLTVSTALFSTKCNKLYVGDPRSTFLYAFSENKIDENEQTFKMDDPKKLFCPNSDTYAISNESETEVLQGEIPKGNWPLVNLFSLKINKEEESILAVYQSGIVCQSIKQKVQQHNIICAELFQDEIVFCHSNNVIQIIQPLNNMKKGPHTILEIPENRSIRCIVKNENCMVVGIADSISQTGTINILNDSLQETHSFELPSQPTSLFLISKEQTATLFVAMYNGSIMSIGIDLETLHFDYRISYIYFGNPEKIIEFVKNPKDENSFFFLDDKVYCYSNSVLHDSSFSDISCFSIFSDQMNNLFIAFIKDGTLRTLNYEVENTSQKTFFMVNGSSPNPIQMCECDKYTFSLSVQKNEPDENTVEYIFAIIAIDENGQVIAKIEHEGNPNNFMVCPCDIHSQSLLSSENAPYFYILCSEDDIIYCFKFTTNNITSNDIKRIIKYQEDIDDQQNKEEENEDEDQAVNQENENCGEIVFIFDQKIDSNISSMCSYGSKIIIASDNILTTLAIKDSSAIWNYGRISFDGKIGKMYSSRNRIWIDVENDGIHCITYNKHDDRFEGIGFFPYKEKITAICPIDDLLTCFSNEKGEITFVSLNRNIILGLNLAKSIPRMQFIQKINVNGYVSLLFTFNNCIYYLKDNGMLCALLPASLITEFRRCERYQFKGVSQYKELIGFFNPCNSLVAQNGVVDIDFLECLASQDIDPYPEFSIEVSSTLSIAKTKINI